MSIQLNAEQLKGTKDIIWNIISYDTCCFNEDNYLDDTSYGVPTLGELCIDYDTYEAIRIDTYEYMDNNSSKICFKEYNGSNRRFKGAKAYVNLDSCNIIIEYTVRNESYTKVITFDYVSEFIIAISNFEFDKFLT